MKQVNGRTVQIKHPVLALLFSFLAGCSLVFAFAPFSYWPAAFIAVIIWLYQINNNTVKQAVKHGFSFGFGYFAAGISWVHVSIEQFGGLPLMVSIALMLMLCAYLALFPALAAYLSAKLSATKRLNLYYLPFIWLFSEYLRSVLLTGFPWLSLGYSQIDSPLAALAPIGGETTISFVIMLTCVTVFQLLNKVQVKANAVVLALVLSSILISNNLSFITTTGKSFTTALVQGNIKQELRWDEVAEENIIDSYLNSTEGLYASNDVVIWPEAAIPRIEPLSQEYLRYLDLQASNHQSSLITGIVNYDPDTRKFFNRLVVLGNKQAEDTQGSYYYGNANHYNKHHLLPIGEFVPFGDLLRPIAPLFNLPMSSFSRGDYVQHNIIANGLNFAPLICFEIAFPQQLAANIKEHTDAILTVSNDAWFGASHGPDQHLEIARMRALEFGKPMLRSTNNGLTAVIDHHGKITADIPQFSKAILQTEVALVTGTTPYTVWGRYLDKILILLFALFWIVKTYVIKPTAARAN